MPVTPTYPGVYIEEIPSGVRTITGVATSITAFLGFTAKGPTNEPVRISNFGDFERLFGGLQFNSMISYAVQQFFLSGGSQALIVRLANKDATAAKISLPPGLALEASSEGTWGNNLKVAVDYDTAKPDEQFNLTVTYTEGENATIETIRNLSVDVADPRYVVEVLKTESTFVRVEPGSTVTARPTATSAAVAVTTQGANGAAPTDDTAYVGSQANKTGLYALEKADLFNLLCIPPVSRDIDISFATWQAALAYCVNRRAILIVDPPNNWNSKGDVLKSLDKSSTSSFYKLGDNRNAAVFFPRIQVADPLKQNRLGTFVPCGIIAGIFSRTDAQRGVWKAPAGIDATLTGVQGLSVSLTDAENGELNPLAINCLRSFPVYGNVVWGSRTLDGADQRASEWKYLPVRRLALYLQESLYRGTQWVVFEPNDEPLWAQIRLNVGAFMNNLFRQGAFQGKSPKEAYFVKCDSETTTQNDINLGIVNIVIGFAPLKPAEFVILKFQQMAGQIAT